MAIRFGTDGWRAVISDEFTFANVRKVAQGIADTFWDQARSAGRNAPPRLVVGFDTRFLSDRYAREVARVLAANDIQVYLTRGDTPTPMVSYAIRAFVAEGGVMITASHNPPRYNGIKVKAAHGGPAGHEFCRQVEESIRRNEQAGREPRTMGFEEAERLGLVQRFDPFPQYREHVFKLVDPARIAAGRLRIVVDPMHGAGRGYFARLLREAGAEVQEIRGEMNPGFGGVHPEPIARNLAALVDAVNAWDNAFGLATDGDADRIGAVAEDGSFVDPHRILSLALRYLVDERRQRGSVVKTVSTTLMVNRLAAQYNLPVHETPVGFHHIADHFLKGDFLIGGEESGGITVQGHIPEGDGMLMGLLLAEIVAFSGGSLWDLVADLYRQVGHFAYARNDVHVPAFEKRDLVAHLTEHVPARLAGLPVREVSTLDGVKYLFDDAWLLIRPSGTEPVLRIYAEAPTDETVKALLDEGYRIGLAAIEAIAGRREPSWR